MNLSESPVLVAIFTVTVPALATLYATKKGNARNSEETELIRELKRQIRELKERE